MKTATAGFVFAAVLALVSAAQAQSSQGNDSDVDDSPASAVAAALPKVVAISGSGSGTFSIVPGACKRGYSAQCHSNDCFCYMFTGTNFSLSRVGKGPANLYATLDLGNAIGSGSGSAECFPVYLEFLTERDNAEWSGIGSGCEGVNGQFSPLVGGFALQLSNVYSAAITQFTLTYDLTKGTFKMTHKGKADL